MITLYPDQEELLEQTRAALRESKSVLIQAVTGFGKTVTSAAMFSSAVSRGKRCMFVVPRRELLRQVSNTLSRYGIDHSFVSAGHPYNPHSLMHVATTETLSNRIDLDLEPEKDLVVYDECHYGKTALGKVIKHYGDSGAYNVGLSATPMRQDGRGLKMWFDRMVRGKSVRWLIDNKRLSDYRAFAPDHPDLSAIPVVSGDYAKGKISDYMEHDRVLVGSAIEAYKKTAYGLLNMSFCTSIKSSEIMNEKFKDAGIPSACVDGKMSDSERGQIFRAYGRRELLNLCTVDLCLFGFDLSSAAGMDVCVESMSDMRPTLSLPLQIQKWGRMMRYKDFPAVLNDHVGNMINADGSAKHGFPDDDRDFTLEDDTKVSRKSVDRVLSIRQCPRCDMVHRPSAVCPKCGYEYPVKSRELEEVEGDLVEVKRSELDEKREMKRERAACKTIDELILFAQRRGYKNPHVWAEKWYSLRGRYRG